MNHRTLATRHALLQLRAIRAPRGIASLASIAAAFVFVVCPAVPKSALAAKPDRPIDFNRDIRPILSNNCFACHGPDETTREADLRLDVEDQAKADRGGYAAVVPARIDDSELLRRVASEDADERMPPADSGKSLTPAQVELLRRWIAEGAKWSLPWTYVAPRRHDAPPVADTNWPLDWIDTFVLARLEAEGLAPSPEADKVTLIRRLSIDLTGLPPEPEQVDAFLADDAPGAYERLVDRLLASPHYGERMAMYWLDLVRYADTVGYHGDQEHHISPYRDYVIEAFNENLPFDQFTREQLAGDLLQSPTLRQRIATGYNRMLQTSHEGGVQPKEYLAIYAADRVRNVSAVWMGATMGCAQCHDHKYDPYTAKDFYSMAAFFADVDEARHFREGKDAIPTPRPPEIDVYTPADQAQLDSLTAQLRDRRAELQALTATLVATGDKAAGDRAADTPAKAAKKPTKPAQPADDAAKKDAAADAANRPQRKVDTDRAGDSPIVAALRDTIAKLDREIATVRARGRRTMITQSIEPRTMRILPRGNWMDDSGPVVQPAVPEFLPSVIASGPRATRLDLANWLTDAEHGVGGLTARVLANRLWYLLFGIGLSRSLDDFGGQGEPPVAPELLDRLAIELVDSGWDVKHLVRLLVTSRAYRQSSLASPELRQRDPLNRLVARQSRYRYPAESVRDTALAISGLLDPTVGGATSNPYQPAGYYQHLNFPKREYKSHDDWRQWRRGVYVHWQRQYLHPTLKALDAPSREECTAERPRSNTPLAALALLNDPSFVEAARVFAALILHEGGDSPEARLDYAFRRAVSRTPAEEERDVLLALLQTSREHYAKSPDDAAALQSVGLAPREESLDATELAAWTAVARAILNMNETYTRN